MAALCHSLRRRGCRRGGACPLRYGRGCSHGQHHFGPSQGPLGCEQAQQGLLHLGVHQPEGGSSPDQEAQVIKINKNKFKRLRTKLKPKISR